ncbi:piggyBac transposable element-derived protein 4-like [Bacillus rossius redtenbacheri]|uniref:piggyBac transposable element-derived protein 4-like n=1 Tax=Bacillus rossius redtenbacheri TaxID=93214 RepID=UPI002FDD0AE7
MSRRKQLYNLSNPRDVEQVMALLEVTLSDDDISDCTDTDADQDYAVSSDHNSSSENDSDEEKIQSNNTEDNYFLGKDRKTKWGKSRPMQSVRTRSHNIVKKLPGVTGLGKKEKSVSGCWSLFFDNNMIEKIVVFTNKYILKISSSYKDPSDCKPTSLTEIKSLLGLLYGMGFLHGGRMNIQDFWSTDGLGTERFPATMAFRRFRFLLKCIRFDDIETRQQRRESDKLAAVREIFEAFNGNCKKYYSMGEFMTLDEMLLSFRGRCGFRMYIPSKPGKYGIKVFALVDAKMYYTYNLEIYCGKQPAGPYQDVSFKPSDIVERMCLPVSESGRNLTIDNWFTSYDIVAKMKNEHNITIVGTVRKNKKELPPHFITAAKREPHSSVFGFQENMTLVSYVPKRGKTVLLLSSMHADDKIDESTGEQKKPEIITFYNSTKGGVDCVDERIAFYNVARNTRRWTMVIFYAMLNIAGVNAYLVYRANDPTSQDGKNRRTFLRKLMFNLTEEHIKERAMCKFLPKSIRSAAKRISGLPEEEEQTSDGNKRGRCAYCKDRKTRYSCFKCRKYLCLEHSAIMCSDCKNDM